jgi:hypothetical protein
MKKRQIDKIPKKLTEHSAGGTEMSKLSSDAALRRRLDIPVRQMINHFEISAAAAVTWPTSFMSSSSSRKNNRCDEKFEATVNLENRSRNNTG